MKNLIISFFILSTLWVSAQSVDSLAAKQLDSLIRVSFKLANQGNFEQALEMNDRAKKITLEHVGKESSAYGRVCFNRGWVNVKSGNYAEAEKWHLEGKAIREKVLGKENADYAESLSYLASLYEEMGNYEKAQPLYLEAIAIQEKVLGKEHLNYLASLNNLAILYVHMGKYERVESLYLEAKEIFEVRLNDTRHSFYIDLIYGLSGLYIHMGRYEEAEPFAIQSVANHERKFGKESKQCAVTLSNLSALYCLMGNYEKAESICLESNEIQERILGKENTDYCSSLHNLAAIYRSMGNYGKSEPLYLEAKAMREKLLGREHPDYASSLSELASLYTEMGNYEKAQPLYLEAIAIQEKVLGKEHPNYARSLLNLAETSTHKGNYEKSILLYNEANDIYERVLGKEHPDYAGNLNNLASVYITLKDYENAEQLSLEAKVILENGVGKEHPFYPLILQNLAIIYMDSKDYEKAEQHFLQSKAILAKVLGTEHHSYAESLFNLAILNKKTKNYEKAEQYILELSVLNQRLITNGQHHLTEHELNLYLLKFDASQNLLLTITQKYGSEKMIEACLNNNLFYKGFLLNATNQVKRLALADSLTCEQFNTLRAYQRRLAALYTVSIVERDSAKIAEIEARVNNLEKELTRTVSGYGDAMRQIKWQEVQNKLKPGEVAVEFVSYNYNTSLQSDSVMYAAFVIKAGESAPHFTILCEQSKMSALFQPKEKEAENTNGDQLSLASRGIVTTSTINTSLYSEALYEMIWQPLEKDLIGIQTIYFSPSGMLHRINMDAIPVSKNEILSDRYRLFDISSTRQLVIPSLVKNISNEAWLFGGIIFEQDSTVQHAEDSTVYESNGATAFQSTDMTLRGGEWNYLPGTESEVNSLEAIMKSAGLNPVLKKGNDATEESVKNAGMNNSISPRILHLATHGYFFPDVASKISTNLIGSEDEIVFKSSDQPMLRSGLIMAGGNDTWKGQKTPAGQEDGVLTAYEISQMNLSNTELVVLSACETGLGDIQGNEGVYGLQRAFKIAGAKYIIMSLWQVPDKQTSLLMTTFYKKWLEEKMTIPEAFHAAQKQLRDNGLDPYNWAGFVLVE